MYKSKTRHDYKLFCLTVYTGRYYTGLLCIGHCCREHAFYLSLVRPPQWLDQLHQKTTYQHFSSPDLTS